MLPLVRSRRVRLFTAGLLILLSIVFAYSLSTGGNGTPTAQRIHLVVGGKLDIEAQLLTKMYVLLLRRGGFDVVERTGLGTNDVVFQAIESGQIDLYPEFTTDGLARLDLPTTHNVQRDYQIIKQGYENKYHLTWLDVAPLDDTYGICTLRSLADGLGVTKISQLAPLASRLTIATPPDGQGDPNVLPGLKPTYGITFGKVIVVDEEKTFQDVIEGQAQLNICYTTSPLISASNFVVLNDDRNSLPEYHPAPLVRDDVLQRAPQIAAVLNPLALKLTTTVSIILQKEVLSGFSVTEVATQWLKSEGLL